MERSLDVVLVDPDELFLKRLAGAIGSRRDRNYLVRAFTEKRKAMELLRSARPDALIIGEDFYCEEMKKCFEGRTIVLSEENGDDSISRYSPVRDLLSKLGEPAKKKERQDAQKNVHITGVMSFCQTEYKNAYALTLAAKEARYKKVLYINLDEFSHLRGRLKTPGGYTISDAIYAYRQSGRRSDFIRKAIGHLPGFDFLAPTPCADDLAGLKPREINKFICDICEEYGYERVILDVGHAIGEPWEIFKFCDDADIPFLEGLDGQLGEFCSYMHQSGKTHVLDILRKIKLSPHLPAYTDDEWIEKESDGWLKWMEESALKA